MSRTVAQINEYARQITGYEKNSDTDEGFITDAFILSSINNALDYMSEQKCFSATGNIQLISGQTEYTLPATFKEFVRNSVVSIFDSVNDRYYPVTFVTEKDITVFKTTNEQQTSFSNAIILMSRRENKLVFENITPNSDHTSFYIRIHFYREHENLTLETETPYRISSSSQRIVEDNVIADIYKRDKEYTLSEKHENKFMFRVQEYKEKELNNIVRQSCVMRLSDFNRGVKRAEVYVS